MLIGLLQALLAAVAYGAATILQALGVRRWAALPDDASPTQRVVAGREYALGLAVDGLGFVAAVLALQRLPLFLVESATASSVAITAVLATIVLGARLSRAEIAALGVVAAGLVALAASAHEGPPAQLGMRAEWWLLAGCVPVLALAVAAYADRDRGRSATLLAVACGLGFGVLGMAARILQVPPQWWRLVAHPAAWALVVGGAVGVVAYGFALDRGRTTVVTAITFATETLVPAAIGLAWLGDRVRDGFWPVAVLGFALTLGGSIALAEHAEPAAGPSA